VRHLLYTAHAVGSVTRWRLAVSLLSLAGTMTKARALAIGAAACLALAAAALIGGINLGRQWERGKQAQLDVTALGRQIGAFSAALDIAARDNAAATASLAAIARSTADDLDSKRIAAERAARSLDRALDARHDLDGVRVGADILRAWNASNAANDPGAAAGAANTDPASRPEPDRPVPGAAAGSGRPSSDAAAQPRAERSAVSRVRVKTRRTVGSIARAGADRGGADCAGFVGIARKWGVTHG